MKPEKIDKINDIPFFNFVFWNILHVTKNIEYPVNVLKNRKRNFSTMEDSIPSFKDENIRGLK